ncbi:MAG: geranylgeranyl reductase family protein [Candidatus Helarchaeota archaeon]|nr:geranylgeranyl reductase family protein [Candidatus Helarchaeota archaeon]
MQYDIIVVGAGTGGALAAKTAAKLGLKTCLLERKPAESVGDKVCGDAIEKRDFDALKIQLPKSDELENTIKTSNLYSPDQRVCRSLSEEKSAGYIINRLKFGQRLLREALDTGLEFQDKMMVLKPMFAQDKVVGVEVKDMRTGEKKQIESKVVIDASGFHSPLRKAMKSPYIENEIDPSDYIVCYREILQVGGMDWDPHSIHIFLSQKRAPGGYLWFFPKSEDCVNLGLGVYADPSYKVKEYYKREALPMAKEPIEIIHQGGGVVPVRHPLWSLVESGIMFVGDAACQVNPLHGGGIGSSMRAGIYAAEAAADAIEQGDYSIDGLWTYNKRYAKEQGGYFASLDLLRLAIQGFTDEELNFGLHRDLLSNQDIMDIASGRTVRPSVLDLIGRAIRGIAKPELLLNLYFINNQMNKMKSLYKAYPDRPNFERWKHAITKLFNKVKRLI